MSEERGAMALGQLIAFLNALNVGDIDSIGAKIEEARTTCLALGEPGLAETLREASSALLAGDVKGYRRKVETVVSKLGHLR